MGYPSRWLVESPTGEEGAVADLPKFLASDDHKGWKVVGETVDGADIRYDKPLTAKTISERFQDTIAEAEAAKAEAEAAEAERIAEEEAAAKVIADAEAKAAKEAAAKAKAEEEAKKKAENAPA